MSTQQSSGPTMLYRQAQQQIQNGQLHQALESLLQFLQARPDVGKVWHQAGQLCLELNDCQQAVSYFEMALGFLDAPPETGLDLIRAYLETGQTSRAVRNLQNLAEGGLLPLSLLDQTAQALVQKGDSVGAMELLLKGNDWIDLSNEIAVQIEKLRQNRAKIAFFCGADGPSFLRDIAEFLGQRHPVRFFEGTTERDVHELMKWSDISWFEWCTNLARIGSKLPKVCRNIVRLHRYEAYLSWPEEINWDNIDRLVLVGNSTVLKALDSWKANVRQRVKIVTVPNGVNLKQIPFKKQPRGKNIAFVAAMRMVKNPMLLLQCMYALHRLDPDYHLYIAGRMQDLLVEHYFKHHVQALGLTEVVHFDGWQEDIQAWLEDKHYLAVTSVIESQGMGALEAIAAGLKPVIHNFPGADEIYDHNYLFNTPEEFCEMILAEEYDPEQYREFVEKRYPLDRTCRMINEMIIGLETAGIGAVRDTSNLSGQIPILSTS